MDEELVKALEEMKTKLEASQTKAVDDALVQFKKDHKGEVDDTKFKDLFDKNVEVIKSEYDDHIQKLQDHIDKLDIKLQKKGGEKPEDYVDVMKKGIADEFDKIKGVTKGSGHKLELKVVGDMTIAANLTGGAVRTYQPGVASIPSQMVNFADLVPQIQSVTGIYVVYRETGSEGGITRQTTPGTDKTQIDYDLTEVTFNATYLSGYARYAKQMAQDLPFLQSFLPMALRRDYFKAENADFYTALSTAATASTNVTGLEIEKLVLDMGDLEANDYLVNGYVLNPKDWARIAITKPSDFSLPSVVTFINGSLVINGVPVFKASWIPQENYLVGDWTQAKKIVTDGLAVEFFEQDRDNVIKNLITARVESRTVLGIDRPDAFILGDFTPTT